jgi:uncharacterized protein (DUF2147 family)
MSIVNSKKYMAFCIALLLCSFIFASDESDKILGIWYTEKCQAIFEFYLNGHEYAGRLKPLQKPDLIDKNNPEDSLRYRKLNGITTIEGLKYDSTKKRWDNGKVYNPQDGKTYSCYCSLSDNGTLLFRGFIGFSALGKNQVWTRECNSIQK